MDALRTTSPFATLDAIHGERAQEIYNAFLNQEHLEANWRHLILNDEHLMERLSSQGLSNPDDFTTIHWDYAMLFFTSILTLTKDGTPLQLGDQKTRERFGRFPSPGGSTMQYILDYICPSLHKNRTEHEEEIYNELSDLLDKLANRCTDAHVGHEKFTSGSGGMHISGFLTNEEVRTLRLHLSSRVWTVSKDEPFDGGLADAIRHFSSILKAAERRNVGILLRYHA
ncbi:MAG: hypothetical protein VW270_21180 [Candidatus Poseidoniales archaeon]